MSDPTPLLVVAGILVRDGLILAARRSERQDAGGLWEFPGGKPEPGESDAQALRRELREELDIEVAVGTLLGQSLHVDERRTISLRAYACTLTGGEPRALEHAELRWLSPAALDQLSWCPADVPLLLPAARWATGACRR